MRKPPAAAAALLARLRPRTPPAAAPFPAAPRLHFPALPEPEEPQVPVGLLPKHKEHEVPHQPDLWVAPPPPSARALCAGPLSPPALPPLQPPRHIPGANPFGRRELPRLPALSAHANDPPPAARALARLRAAHGGELPLRATATMALALPALPKPPRAAPWPELPLRPTPPPLPPAVERPVPATTTTPTAARPQIRGRLQPLSTDALLAQMLALRQQPRPAVRDRMVCATWWLDHVPLRALAALSGAPRELAAPMAAVVSARAGVAVARGADATVAAVVGGLARAAAAYESLWLVLERVPPATALTVQAMVAGLPLPAPVNVRHSDGPRATVALVRRAAQLSGGPAVLLRARASAEESVLACAVNPVAAQELLSSSSSGGLAGVLQSVSGGSSGALGRLRAIVETPLDD